MEIAVVVVNYNTREYLARCLHSIRTAARPGGASLHTIVVDNASRDHSAQLVAAEFPEVQLFASPHNLGFTGGNNLALAALGFPVEPPTNAHDLLNTVLSTPPDYVLLLNPDAELTTYAVLNMVTALEHAPQAAVCGAHLRYGDGSFQDGAFRFPGLAQVALDLFPLYGVPAAHRLYSSAINGRYAQHLWQGEHPFPVDFVLGAAMLVRGRALAQVGGLDDAYFMYCEEMDWCLRFAIAGWQVLAAPTAHVIHHAGQSSRQVRWQAYARLWRSRFRFYAQYPQRYPPAFHAALRVLVRSAILWKRRQAQRRFAAGLSTGQELAQELDAYAILARL